MSALDATHLPSTFNRLAWSNLAAQLAEQTALAASPIVAVLLLGVGEGETGLLQTALTRCSRFNCGRGPQPSFSGVLVLETAPE